jgi:hypothetical protein
MKDNLHKLDEDTKQKILQLAENGAQRGISPGFDELSGLYTLKPGSTTYVIASPHSGKTQFSIEIMINTAQFSNWNWLVYSPETGSPADVFAELMWAYLGKPIVKNNVVAYASPKELERAYDFVKQHFFIIDGGIDSTTVHDVYSACDKLLEDGVRVDGILIDPFTEIDLGNLEGRDDVILGNALTLIRKYSSENKVHTMVTVHTKYQQQVTAVGVDGRKVFYYPEADYNSIAGGQMWSRKGMMMISLWRCPENMADENGYEYEKNQVKVKIIKAKPKAVGQLGHVYLYYDRVKNRYYVKEPGGTKRFAEPEFYEEHSESVQGELFGSPQANFD